MEGYKAICLEYDALWLTVLILMVIYGGLYIVIVMLGLCDYGMILASCARVYTNGNPMAQILHDLFIGMILAWCITLYEPGAYKILQSFLHFSE